MSSPRSRPPEAGQFRGAVRRWAQTVDRPLPWRGERDPYRVLVSEVMLQQTQASRVVPSYEGFLRRFPDVDSLARASTADVLREWGSLGYNRRALNLWRAARTLVARADFPRTIEELQALPGVGPYTARAVASFAFGAHVGVVDANVRRVISRALESSDVQATADALTPKTASASWNQAMIDMGALVCTARNPSCSVCPLCRWCTWRPAAESRAKAKPFKETARYVRGRIVSELRAGSRSAAVLERRVGVSRPRFAEAIAGLERDELVHRAGRRVALGSVRDSHVLLHLT